LGGPAAQSLGSAGFLKGRAPRCLTPPSSGTENSQNIRMTLGAGGDVVVVRQTPAQPTNAANRTGDAKSLGRSPSIAEVSTPSLLLLRSSVRFIVPCLGLAALLVLWALLSWSGAVNELLLPSPLAVLKAGTEEAANGVLVDNILISVKRVLT